MRLTRPLRCALTIALLIPATASAADRFATPTGSASATCPQSNPCDIVTAINSASNGDDITIEPGSYGSPLPLTTSLATNGKTLAIHGAFGQPMPVIHTAASAFGIGLDANSSLSDVDVEDSSNTLRARGIEVESPSVSAIDHVISHMTGTDLPIACAPIGTLIESLCWSAGAGGTGAEIGISGPSTQTTSVINDTFIGDGAGGDGVLVLADGTFTTTLNMTNSIARGDSAGFDVYMDSTGGSTAILHADHSNYGSVGNALAGGTITATPAGSGSNQTTAPVFAADDDFREAGTSPTVGAGVVTALAGTTDLVGAPRQIGAHTDIGAYEFIPPPTCQPVSASTVIQTAVQIQLSCTDLAGATISYFYSQHPAHGTVSIDSASGVATYTPAAGYSGSDSFTYDGHSSHGESATATVSIAVGTGSSIKTPAPVISHFKHKGKDFSFTLSADAKVTLTIKRKGHRAHKISGKLSAGTDKIKLSRKLKPGRYTVTLSATNSGGTSKQRALRFKIKH